MKDKLLILSVTVHPYTIDELIQYIAMAISKQERWIIANHNLHSIYLFQLDQKMREFYKRAYIIHIDGMPLIYWGRILGYPLRHDQRVTYVDLIHPLIASAAREGWRIYYLGGKPTVAALAAEKLRCQYPKLQIATHHGYFQPEQHRAILQDISMFKPHILMVGMGMPRQEHWIIDHIDDLTANAILTAGACFDYIAGVIPTPPRWIGKIGLEWLYRLLSEPRRLSKRYLIEPWYLLPLAVADLRKIYFSARSR